MVSCNHRKWRGQLCAVTLGITVAMVPGLAGAELPPDCRQDADLALKTAICSAIIASDAPAEDRAEALYQRARAHTETRDTFEIFHQGEYGYRGSDADLEALFDVRDAIRLAPGVARYWTAIARLLDETGDTQAADAYLSRAEQLGAPALDLLLARAAAAVRQRNGDKAVELLAQALALEPANLEAFRLRATLAFDSGDFEKMLRLADEILRLAPDQPRSHVDRGFASLLNGKMDQAVADLEDAVRLGPKFVSARRVLGLAYLRQGRPEAARDACEAMVDLDPSNPDAHACVGIALTALGATEAARAAFDEVLRLASQYTRSLANEARVWSSRERPDLMMETYDLGILIDPSDSWLIDERARAHMELGETDAAIADFTLAVETERQNPEAYHQLIWAYEKRAAAFLELGHPDDAVRDFRAAFEMARPPARWTSCFDYARDLQKNGVIEPARDFYQTCLKSAPHNPNGIFGYATLLADEGRLDEAFPRFETALQIASDRGVGVADMTSALRRRAWTMLDEGDAAAALKLFGLVLHARPGNSEAQEDVADALRVMGDLPRAIEAYGKAIALDQNRRTAWRYRGDCFASLGDVVSAISDYTQAIAVDPDYKQAYKRRGDAYSDLLEDQETAIRDYSRAIEIDPDYASALEARRNAFYKTGNYADALIDADRVINMSPDPDPGDLMTRGRIRRMLGDAVSAIDDFRRSSDLGSHYAALYLFLMRFRDDPDGAVVELRAHSATLADGEWPKPVMVHLLGDLTLKDMFNLASGADELCEAKFYAGSLLQLREHPEMAKALYHEAVAICPHSFIEYNDALNALTTLGEREPL